MTSIERFKRRVQRSGVDMKEKALSEGIRNFRKTLHENPTCVEVQATVPDEVSVTSSTRKILAMITDVALNDQRALDDKYLQVDIDENIDVGCYVKWQGINWLLVYQEVNGFSTHKTFVMKRCNQIFRFMKNSQIYDIPICATNLTLYSDGLADGVYLSRADAKRNVKFGSNPITRSIDIGFRVMLTNKTVFKITHIDDFSYNGLVACIVGQTALVPEDNQTDNIAFNKDANFKAISEKQLIEHRAQHSSAISGEEEIFLGSDEVYEIDAPYVEWELEGCECFSINQKSNGKCVISTSSNSKYVGESAILIATEGGFEISRKIISVKSCF